MLGTSRNRGAAALCVIVFAIYGAYHLVTDVVLTPDGAPRRTASSGFGAVPLARPPDTVARDTLDPRDDPADLQGAFNRTQRDLPARDDGDGLNHLVIVPCHGAYRAPDFRAYQRDDSWGFEPDQRGHGLPNTIARHIKRAIEIGEQDAAAVVIFSGGQTRHDSAARSEAQSYMDVALANDFPGAAALLGDTQAAPAEKVVAPARRRMYTEEHARDSYENVLFGLCRFFEATGRWPKRITVVGFEYKRRRFIDLHRVAVRWPLSAFEYLGIDPVASDLPEGAAMPPALNDERTYARVRSDLYLCAAGRATRAKRNPNRHGIPYYSSVPQTVLALMMHCGNTPFRGPLPWRVAESS